MKKPATHGGPLVVGRRFMRLFASYSAIIRSIALKWGSSDPVCYGDQLAATAMSPRQQKGVNMCTGGTSEDREDQRVGRARIGIGECAHLAFCRSTVKIIWDAWNEDSFVSDCITLSARCRWRHELRKPHIGALNNRKIIFCQQVR